jgi:membrane-bound lytic murein transglycosylase D
MTRSAAAVLLLLLAACGTATTGTDVTPSPEPAAPPSGAARVPAAPRATSVDDEVDASVRAAADSLADAEALEQLATVDAGGDSSAVPESFSLDISSYRNHDRVRYYLNFFTGPGRERMRIWLERLPRYEGMIRDRMAERGLPGDLVYLALIESGFSNRAVSRASAVGMWQFMSGTGKAYGLRIDAWLDERRDPVKATAAAARHLSDLQERFGSLYLAAAAYNGGAGRVGRGVRSLGSDAEENGDETFFRLYNTRYIFRETKDYVPKLIAAALIGRNPAEYGFTDIVREPPFEADSLVVRGMTGLDVIAELSDTSMAAISELNPQVLRLVTPPRTAFTVLVPEGTGAIAQERLDSLPEEAWVSFREHKVKAGETPAGIAEEYGTTAAAIREANPNIGNRALRSGQRLVIPSGTPMSVVVARTFAEPAEPEFRVHRVRSGETLSHLAVRYNVSVAAIQRWNGLKNSRIRIGQRLRIGATGAERARAATASTGSTATRHVVRSGETLTGVARRYGVSLSALARANDLTTRSKLRIGQRLRIPR